MKKVPKTQYSAFSTNSRYANLTHKIQRPIVKVHFKNKFDMFIDLEEKLELF